MSFYFISGAIIVAAIGSLVFSTLTSSLRDLSRSRLADYLQKHKKSSWLDATVSHADDLAFVTAVCRLLCNMAVLFGAVWIGEQLFEHRAGRYAAAALVAIGVTLFFSILIPTAITRHAGDAFVGLFVRPLSGLRLAFVPLTSLLHGIDRLLGRAFDPSEGDEAELMEQEIQQELLSVFEEGEKEGVVDEEEREMIESVIHFRDTTAGQIMTPRPEINALPLSATLAEIKQKLEESGHSRLPVYDGTLDHIAGVLYSRDLLKYVGQLPDRFTIKTALRPPIYVPETKPLRDLLDLFRDQKVHIAIVLDEYGGTAGLVTIEDVLEELVGDISDEHEPVEPDMFKRIDETTMEADARIYVDELNRLANLNLPEDAGYDTLSGYVTTTLGKIPTRGAMFESGGVRFTVLEAEPQRVSRVKIETIRHPLEFAAAPTAPSGRSSVKAGG